MKCVICKQEAVMLGETSTYEGFVSPPGHNHDDNCVVRTYACSGGHKYIVSKRNRCPAEGCDWIGIDQCHCHGGIKVDKWPDEATPIIPA